MKLREVRQMNTATAIWLGIMGVVFSAFVFRRVRAKK